MITNGFELSESNRRVDGPRSRKIASSGEFMTTLIFSTGQLRLEMSSRHASLVVIATSAKRRLHFFRVLRSHTAKLLGRDPEMVIINSGIGSWMSRMAFPPRSFGTKALNTRTSGIL